jgi:hypothetical protein
MVFFLSAPSMVQADMASSDNPLGLEVSIQQIDGETGFEIGYGGEPIISKLTYDLDGTLIQFSAHGPLSFTEHLSYRLTYAASVTMEGNSTDLDWEDGFLTDSSVSESEVDASLWSAELMYELHRTEKCVVGLSVAYSSRNFDIETENTMTSLESGFDVDYFDEGPVSEYEIDFTSFDIGLYGRAAISDKLTVEGRLSWSPLLEAESQALWILRDYPFEQSADGTAFTAEIRAVLQLSQNWALLAGIKMADLTAEDGTESGIADGVEPYENESIVPEMSADYTIAELGVILTF